MLEVQLNNAQTILAPQKDSTSRYYYTNYVKDENNYIVFNLFQTVSYDNDTSNIRYHIVTDSEANRLDKIAQKYYNDSTYWWLIAIANNIINPFILTAGTTIKIPNTQTYIAKGVQ